jgi:hypothetical protein
VNVIVSTSIAAILAASTFGVAATTDLAPPAPPVDAWCALGMVRPGQPFSRTELGAPKGSPGLLNSKWSRTFYPNFNCGHPIGQRPELRPGPLSSS